MVVNVRDPAAETLAPIAAATFAALSKAKPSEAGFVNCGSTQLVHCSVSAQMIRRTGEILDALERALPQVDAALVHDKEGKRVAIRVRGELLGLSLTEGYKRTETVVKHPKHSYLDRREYQYEFNGQLKLSLEGSYAGRKSWSDGTLGRFGEQARARRARRGRRF